MNTVKKGNLFEENSLKIIYNAIEEKRLGVIADFIKVFSKKAYFSKDRESDIIFDLAIEIWPPNADNYSLLYLVECKDYNKPVPVDDIEEFYAKIIQVAGVNVKGVFITSKGFQESAYKYAVSKGMMLIVGDSSINYDIILYRTSKSKDGIPKIINPILEIKNTDNDVLEKLVDDTIRSSLKFENSDLALIIDYNISYLSKKDIETKANEILDQINLNIRSKGDKLFTSTLKNFIEQKHNISIDTFNENSLLGKYDSANKKISINSSLIDTNRYPFVLAHEFGHFILHQNLRIEQEVYNNFSDSLYNFSTRKYDLSNPKQWIEWQANYFAISLLLPAVPLKAQLQIFTGSSGPLYLDDQYANIKKFNEVIAKLSNRYYLSKTTIINRLDELKLLNKKSRLKTIGEIIQENVDEFFL